MAFFPLSGQNSARALGSACRRPRGRHPLELVYGISRGPGCSTLLLYFRPGCSNYVPHQLELRRLEPLTPAANNRQHVHPSVQPQVSVRTRPRRSTEVRACCGTFLLYFTTQVHSRLETLRHSTAPPQGTSVVPGRE
jgi:hypothetical protein